MAPLIGRDCAQGAFMRAETSFFAKEMCPPFRATGPGLVWRFP